MNKSDFQALMSSEVFRNYAKAELSKPQTKEASTEEVIESFISLEEKIKNNSKLKRHIKNMQNKIATDVQFSKKLDANFIQAINMLDLEDV